VALNSGTSALHVALLAAGVGAGDRSHHHAKHVYRHSEAISYAGAKPVSLISIQPTAKH